ncbi:hypothetical protein HIM_08173 [Hirsutella minnesotensis 3608]|uniref:Peptidase M43 pregnancy-associated plasma-A domain-containing protein n=1 Tax=Hirsutella minnesotensis 3608 TaxID=1043627 RepID=A0A0F8A3V8_9HYPO|nr:hypothetical protein HIM_08173 [Hirsutella minnesotensis 3608]
MIPKTLLVAASLATAAVAGVVERAPVCGAPAPDDEHLKQFAEGGIHARQSDNGDRIVIPTVIHVVSEDNTLEGGRLSEQSVRNEMDITNRLFEQSGISFRIDDIIYTQDRRLATYGHDEGRAMKDRLRRGDFNTLNIYYVRNFASRGTKGICSYPPRGPGAPLWFDGCAVASDTVPGGPRERINGGNPEAERRKNDPNDLGITKVTGHEIGHWLGLPHTFSQKGLCESFIDTPPESGPAQGCAPGQNLCRVSYEEELLLNTNVMSYASCADQKFTNGQMQVMRSVWDSRQQITSMRTGGGQGPPRRPGFRSGPQRDGDRRFPTWIRRPTRLWGRSTATEDEGADEANDFSDAIAVDSSVQTEELVSRQEEAPELDAAKPSEGVANDEPLPDQVSQVPEGSVLVWNKTSAGPEANKTVPEGEIEIFTPISANPGAFLPTSTPTNNVVVNF